MIDKIQKLVDRLEEIEQREREIRDIYDNCNYLSSELEILKNDLQSILLRSKSEDGDGSYKNFKDAFQQGYDACLNEVEKKRNKSVYGKM